MQIEQLNAMTKARLMVIDASAAVQAAALSLSKPGIGLVVVCDDNGAAAGVLSKSDLIRHLTSRESPAPPASALMTSPIVSCGPQDDLHTAYQTMASRSLQNLPVLDVGAKPIGVLDIRDAMRALFREEEVEEQMLFNYVTGVGYR
ncbi:CBS domain-containing protein [Mesorhizobium sp. B2-3-10]|uniref:CBS domain-containing protein n=1 Tax=Mesorhizobium sp. B2-3-10 TaxID=2589954 RepID=UPI001126F733|nr:CBS domain-containing protein [Mesorhizobium sp. B2-3-10]TPL99713.1 CBS domain-containing protein [Mesorhizobium sp. B2-3-10]